MVLDMSQYKTLFLETARKLVADYTLIKSFPVTDHTTQDILIMFHSLKGEAMAMGYKNLATLSLQIETLCRTLVENKMVVDDTLKGQLPLPKVLSDNLDSIEKTNTEASLAKETEDIQKMMDGIKSKPLSILLVEDNIFFQNVFIDKLREKSALVDISDNGEDAVARMVAKKYDCILLDIIMPKKNGFEILKFAKENNIIPQTPIIAISTLGQEDDVKKALEMGAVDYIKKGDFDFNLLLPKIESVIGKK